MTITLEQIDNTLRTYKKAFKNNLLTEKEKKECLKKIGEFQILRKKFLKEKNDN